MSVDSGENKLAGILRAPIESSNSSTLVFWSSSCGPIPSPVFTIDRYTDKNLQIATKLTLESFLWGQEYGQAQALMASAPAQLESQKQTFKAYFLKLYFGN